MVAMLLVLLLILALFGAGFAVDALWIAAAVLLVAWLAGFFLRSGSAAGGRARWYRW